ncbi:LuxR C-terminal-related transcriptional regulator [Actinoplanes sp. NBRC 101535]|uniref:LuxR C-terminal-related transcriptional regulator n=1 Tax=Actinoplanes sp. NBRC 101535 TaxID=3032196 RepID=UPI0024A33CB7|nr:LuxR C-terminal-related transcriptional regulator [Actinoplanes sp. NBRC 101535]GLY05541.1 transcriptional regulator [Actinoplanes sp. NBRC 101535]
MQAEQTAIPSLGRWGLSAHADLTYRALLLAGVQDSNGLARHLGVPAFRIVQALEELAACGAAVQVKRGSRRLWQAAAPDQVMARLRQRRDPVVVTELVRRHIATVSGLHLDRVLPGGVHRFRNRFAARQRIAELTAAERHEHLAINTEDVFTAEATAAAAPLDEDLIGRGIRLRVLGLRPRDGSVRPGPPPGGEYRETSRLPLKLMLFDRCTALIPADPTDFEAGALEIVDPDAVAHLTELFHRIWRTAEDPGRREVPDIELSAREEAVVGLLAAGATEDAVAEHLGISRRTVVYTLRALMDRLGVDNRFQLALLLGAARAVPLPPVGTKRTEES